MIRFLPLLIVLLLAVFPVQAQDRDEKAELPTGDVRNLVWGLPRSYVIEFEEADHLGTFEAIEVFEGADMGHGKTYMQYYFIGDDVLYRAELDYKPRLVTPEVGFNDYLSVRDKYVEAYGEPTEEFLDWTGDDYKENPEKWGMALYAKQLSILTIWDLPKTRIRMIIRGKGYKWEHLAEFESKKLAPGEADFTFIPDTP